MTNEPAPRRVRGWLIASAAVLVLCAIMHTIAMYSEQKPANPDQARLLDLMNTVKLDLPGSPAPRTTDDLFKGFGWLMDISAVGLGLLALMFAFGTQPAASVRRVTIAIAFTLAAYTVISVVYFFSIPIAFFGLAFLFAAISLAREPRTASPTPL